MKSATSTDGRFTGEAIDEQTARMLADIWEATMPNQHRAGWSVAALRETGYHDEADAKERRGGKKKRSGR